ncbi:putative ATP synthase protein I [metagenome]|uniref:Putative ATP synthase protein I n=1 Tax=metagenome TaxID=256318 RepID=A0A2P2CHN0_9ZZZZ
MTTESTQDTRTGFPPLLGALAAGAAGVLVLVVAAALVDDRAAVVGAAGGGVLTLAVFAAGIAVVTVVARLMPSASLLVALMTYALQLLVLALCVAALERSGVTEDDLSRGWFAAAVIAVAMLWIAGQLVAATRQRIPAYDLAPDASPDASPEPVAADEPAGHPGGER